MDALQKAINVFGTQAALARALGVVPMTVSQWTRRGVPLAQCPRIEAVTDGKVTRADLRPDVFGDTAA